MFSAQSSRVFLIRVAPPLLVSATALVLTACGGVSSITQVSTTPRLQGSVHGGQQPVSLANIKLYSVDVTNGIVSQLNVPAATDLNGQFSITLDYVCPSPTTPMFITATDGNPGLNPPVNNTALSLAAALGDCGTLSANTYITINEVTTAAFAAQYNAIQTVTTAPLLEAALARAMNFADFATGTSPGPGQTSTSNGGNVPAAAINTLGNIIATCVNSNGSTASTDPCGQLFALTGSPTDTFTALTNLEGSPSSFNASHIYALATSTGPFQPALAAAPPTWAITAEQPIGPSGQMTATPAAGVPGDTVVITSNDPPSCPISPPLTVEFGTTYAAGSFTTSEIIATVPGGATSGGSVTTPSGTCTFPFNVQAMPAYALSAQTLHFNTQATGTQSVAQTVSFTNHNGSSTAVIVGGFTLSSTPASSFKTTADTCTGTTVSYGGSCSVSIVFAPKSTGAATGTLTFYVGGVAVTATTALTGTGN